MIVGISSIVQCIHCVGKILDPEWNGKGHEKVKEFMIGFQKN
jgi:hypothetical protein